MNVEKLKRAEALIHEWVAENQYAAPEMAFQEAVKAELIVMDAINFVKAKL